MPDLYYYMRYIYYRVTLNLEQQKFLNRSNELSSFFSTFKKAKNGYFRKNIIAETFFEYAADVIKLRKMLSANQI